MYDDSLITITGDSIILKCYYFPVGLSKRILFTSIENIQIYEPTLLSGKYRIWGSGDFMTWFPLDFKRPSKDRIFIINIKDSFFRSGFTTESPFVVMQALTAKGVVVKQGV